MIIARLTSNLLLPRSPFQNVIFHWSLSQVSLSLNFMKFLLLFRTDQNHQDLCSVNPEYLETHHY